MAKPLSISSLDAHLGYWLRFLSNHVSHAFKLKVEAHDVTVAEWVVLRTLLETGPVNPSQIAEKLGMTRGAISKLVDRLIAKKLATCTHSKKDRRFQSIALTAAGQKIVPILAALADENDAEFFGHLGVSQQDDLKKLLQETVRRRALSGVPVD
jgi:DNA-binding MarR family transcriptional regulator